MRLTNRASVAFYFNSATDGAAAFDFFTAVDHTRRKMKFVKNKKNLVPQFTDVGRVAA